MSESDDICPQCSGVFGFSCKCNDDPDEGYEQPIMCDNCGRHVDDCECN